MRARHVRRVGPADVGSRVSVRRWLDEEQVDVGDVVGELLAWDDDVLHIETRDGRVVQVEAGRILASRVVPPPPPRPGRP